jgi:hypothetical protein
VVANDRTGGTEDTLKKAMKFHKKIVIVWLIIQQLIVRSVTLCW